VVDHHPDFFAGAAQLHRMSKRQGRLVSDRARAGGGEAIIE
jgi:hypothetical protein